MIKILFILSCLAWIPIADAAEALSPRIAQRLMTLIDRSAEDPEGSLEEMKAMAEDRRRDSTDRGYIMYERAVLLIEQNQIETARAELEETLQGQPEDYVPRLRILLAQLYLVAEQPALAIPQLEVWVAHINEPRPSELSLMGYAYLQLERFEEAAGILERAIELAEDPQLQWIELLAFAYTRIGRTQEAVDLLENIINQQPDQARWWRQLASIYLLMEDLPKGTAGLAISSLVEELSYENARRLASLFTALNMPADAATVLATAMQEKTDSINFEDQMLLGEIWAVAREFDLAIQAFKQASTVAEDGEPAMKMGQLYLQWEKYQQARDALTIAIQMYGEQTPPQVHYLLAVVEINLDNLQAASDALIKLENDEDYAERAQRLDQFIKSRLEN